MRSRPIYENISNSGLSIRRNYLSSDIQVYPLVHTLTLYIKRIGKYMFFILFCTYLCNYTWTFYHEAWFYLSLCGLVTPNCVKDLGNIGSGNGLLPDGTKPLPEPKLTSAGFHLTANSREITQPSITKIIFKITHVKLRSNLPGANQLKDLCCALYM